jgi:hypothetical protein
MRRSVTVLAALALLLPTSAAAEVDAVRAIVEGVTTETDTTGEVDARDIERIAHFPYGNRELSGSGPFFASGTDLAFDGDYVYAAEQAGSGDSSGGVHIIDVSDPDDPVKVGFVDCPGYQNDVAVVRPGVIALGYHSLAGGAGTGDPADSDCPEAASGGVTLFDVTDPAEPVPLGTAQTHGQGTHTLTVNADGTVISASPGGIANGAGFQYLIDVSDVTEEEYPTTRFKPNETGCHDFTFFESVDGTAMGVCVGLAESQIWDVTDPLAPSIVTSIVNPLIDFMHSAAVSEDGRHLVISDEAIVANECLGGPTGAMFSYDISNPLLPIPLAYFGIDRAHEDTPLNSVNPAGVSPPGMGREHWCTAHLYNFIPGTNLMVASWYSGGVNIIDWGEDFRNPREIAHFRTDGVYADDEVTNYWSAYWHEGRIYANDRVRGLDVLRWTAAEDVLDAVGDDGLEDPEVLTAVARALPSTPASTWRSGRFFDRPTPAQQAWLDALPQPSLLGGLSALSCRLPLLQR